MALRFLRIFALFCFDENNWCSIQMYTILLIHWNLQEFIFEKPSVARTAKMWETLTRVNWNKDSVIIFSWISISIVRHPSTLSTKILHLAFQFSVLYNRELKRKMQYFGWYSEFEFWNCTRRRRGHPRVSNNRNLFHTWLYSGVLNYRNSIA